MKPRTNLQKLVAGRAKALPALTKHQFEEAVRIAAPHIAKRNSKGVYICTDCLHQWKAESAAIIRCPHCGNILTVDSGRRYNRTDSAYVATISRNKEFQVIRQFILKTVIRRGEPAQHEISEVFQRWIAPDGKQVIMGLCRLSLGFYVDRWDYNSAMEIRAEHYVYSIFPYVIIGKTTTTDMLKRNGFDGHEHDVNPHYLLPALMKNNKIETLWKAKQYKLVKYLSEAPVQLSYWNSIRIALRHNYTIEDCSLWFDYMRLLSQFDKDLHNPKLICPTNLKEAHDFWQRKVEAKRERERRQRELEIQQRREQEYLADLNKMAEDERKYAEAKSKFFDIELKDEDIVVRPLASIKDFIDEWKVMGHCVFTNKYYEKDESLILRAIENNVSVATIELSLKTLSVLQCRGPHNCVPKHYDRIVALINAKRDIFLQRMNA